MRWWFNSPGLSTALKWANNPRVAGSAPWSHGESINSFRSGGLFRPGERLEPDKPWEHGERKAKPRFAYAATDFDGDVCVWSIRGLAQDARQELGSMFAEDGDASWRDGYKRARKAGYRVVKVKIEVVK